MSLKTERGAAGLVLDQAGASSTGSSRAAPDLMPLFASFEGYETTGRLLFAGWLIAAGLALLALLLACAPRTRRASQGCAIACVAASVPVNLVDVLLWAAGGFDLLLGVLYLSWKFAPLIIAVCVFWFDERRLRKNIDLTKLHNR